MMVLAWTVMGIIIGAIAGLTPGISVTVLMLALMPLLAQIDLVNLFVFYFAFLISTQYFGSITAIAFGIPGEISSVPAVTHGHRLWQQGQGSMAMAITATGSLIASVIGCLILLMVYFNTQYLSYLFNTAVLTVMYAMVLTILILMVRKTWLGILMLTVGLVLGKVGFDALHGRHVMTVPYGLFESGVPFFPLFAGFLIVPMLLRYMQQPATLTLLNYSQPMTMWHRLAMLIRPRWSASILRGSAVGAIMGLVPGASYLTSSTVADRIEHRVSGDNDFKRLVAAESANNAAAITVLIPLLVFAIPIVPSEAVVLSLAESQGFSSTMSLTFLREHLIFLISMILCVSLANWLLAGYFYHLVTKIYWCLHQYIYKILLIFCALVLVWVAWNDREIVESLITLVASILIGQKIKDDNAKTVMLFGFFLSDSVLDELFRFVLIYF